MNTVLILLAGIGFRSMYRTIFMANFTTDVNSHYYQHVVKTKTELYDKIICDHKKSQDHVLPFLWPLYDG